MLYSSPSQKESLRFQSSDKTYLRKCLDFNNSNKNSHRYLCTLLAAELNKKISEEINRVDSAVLPRIAAEKIALLLKDMQGVLYSVDRDSNIWIYHEANESDPEGTYIKVYTTGKYPGQFGPASKKKFEDANRNASVSDRNVWAKLKPVKLWQPLFKDELEDIACPVCGSKQGETIAFNTINGFYLSIIRCSDGMIYLSPRPKAEWWGRLYAADEYFDNALHHQFGYGRDYKEQHDRRIKDAYLRVDEVERFLIGDKERNRAKGIC